MHGDHNSSNLLRTAFTVIESIAHKCSFFKEGCLLHEQQKIRRLNLIAAYNQHGVVNAGKCHISRELMHDEAQS